MANLNACEILGSHSGVAGKFNSSMMWHFVILKRVFRRFDIQFLPHF